MQEDCFRWKGLRSKKSLLSHRLSLQVNGSEDYRIRVWWLAIEFLERDGQIRRAESNIMGYHSSPRSSYGKFTLLPAFAKPLV